MRVAETRSFVGAAKLVGISQPAVSQAIAKLEDYYPGFLFVRRRGGPLTLTPIGEALLPHAKAMLQSADQSFLITEAASSSRLGKLSIGVYVGIASGPLREGLKSFRTECPDVVLNVVEGMPGELHPQLCENALDLVVAAFLPKHSHPAFEQEILWSEQLVALLPDSHDLADRKSLDWSEVAKLPIILRTAGGDLSGYRAVLAGVGQRSLNCEQYAVSRGTLAQMVTMGFGVAISFASAAAQTPGLVAVPIEGQNALVPVEAVWRALDQNAVRLRLLHHLRSAAAR